MSLRWWCACVCYVLMSPVWAALPALDLAWPHEAIGESVAYLADPQGNLTPEYVASLPRERFVPLAQPVASHTFTRAAYWYRFSVQNRSSEPVSRILWLLQGWLDKVDFTIVAPNGVVSHYHTGNGLPFSARAIAVPAPNVRVLFLPGQSEVLLRVQTPDPFIASINVTTESQFLYSQMFDGIFSGLVYGAILAMLLYNLLLFVGTRERYQLAYVGYLATFVLMNAAYNNYTFPWLFADNPGGQDWMQSGAIFLFLCAGLIFTRSFLELHQRHLRLYRLTSGLLYLTLLLALSGPIIGYPWHVEIAIVMSSLVSAYSFCLGLYSWRCGDRAARFFLLGTMSGLVGTMVTACTVMAFVPFHYVTYKAIDGGLVVDGILMSLALIDRIKQVREQRLRAELESRTDSLTGLYNRRAYQEISQQEVGVLQQREQAVAVLLLDINHFKQINDIHGHAAGDAMLQHVASLLRQQLRHGDYAFRMGGDEFLLLLPGLEADQAALLIARLRLTLSRCPLRWQDGVLAVSVSIGSSQWLSGEPCFDSVLRRADAAMYQDKQQHRDAASAVPELVNPS